ncbi:hypothetical protein HAV15_005618 [Penicillium sp. str. |nr:hypothetical protein HAV15_005618 [Penicillium sp. str. \
MLNIKDALFEIPGVESNAIEECVLHAQQKIDLLVAQGEDKYMGEMSLPTEPPFAILDVMIETYIGSMNQYFPIWTKNGFKQMATRLRESSSSERDMASIICYNNLILIAMSAESLCAHQRDHDQSKGARRTSSIDTDIIAGFLANAKRAIRNIDQLVSPRLLNIQALLSLGRLRRFLFWLPAVPNPSASINGIALGANLVKMMLNKDTKSRNVSTFSTRRFAEIAALSQAKEKGYADSIKIMKGHPSGPAITNLLYQVVVHVDQPQDDRAWEYPAPRQALKPEPLLDELELHEILGVSPQHSTNDIQLILKELDQFSFLAQAQAKQVFASPTFTSWMASTQPTSLLVYGNFADSGPGRITPLSILCAMLALQLRRNSNAESKPTIILHYFCGLHGSRHNRVDSLVGPNGLIRSFLAQLLQMGRRFNLDFINTTDFVHQLEAHNIQKLCSTFLELIEQLSRKATIICILDGLSEFTLQQFKDELVDVVHILNRLVTHRTLHPNFKLLCTTPLARDRLFDQQLNVEYPLQLQHAIEDADEPAFTDRAFENLTSQTDRLDHFRMRMRMN